MVRFVSFNAFSILPFQVKELSGKVDLNEKFDASINAQHAGITPLALACALNKVEMVKVMSMLILYKLI